MKLLAYVDPGLGALIWQSAVAGVVGFLFYLKKTRRWIVNLFRQVFGRGQRNGKVTATTTVTTEGFATKVESKIEAR